MKQLSQIFMYEGRQVRTVVKDGEPWFVAKDVCDALDIGNPSQAVSRLDEDEKGLISIDTLGGKQDMSGVSEPGLYDLILGSKKTEAKPFKRWVKHEVLPTIRKHGAYMTAETIEKTLADPDFIIRIATELKTERLEKQALELKIAADRPKVVFAESLEVSNDTILIGQLAKILKQNGVDLGQNRLFEILREEGYLMKIGERRNQPAQRSMDLGLMMVKVGTRSSSTEGTKNTYTTKVTGKGIMYFINKFKNQSQSA